MSVFNSFSLEPLRFIRQRPLLCAVGSAIVATGSVYLYRRYFGKESRRVDFIEPGEGQHTSGVHGKHNQKDVLAQIMEEMEELPPQMFSPRSGPLVLYMPVWRLVPSPRRPAVLKLTHAGKLLLAEFTSLETLTFFLAPIWPKQNPKAYLTLAGEMAMEDLRPLRQPIFLPEPEPPKVEDQTEEEPKRFYLEELSGEDLPLVSTWSASELKMTKRHFGRLQNLEEVLQLIRVVMHNRTQLWWSRVLRTDILTPEGWVAMANTVQEVTGVQLLDGRRVSHVKSHRLETRQEFSYFEDGKQVNVNTTFEGFEEAGGETRTNRWSDYNTETILRDPPSRRTHSPSPSPPPPPPPFENDSPPQAFQEEIVKQAHVEVPLMQSYFAHKGTTNFQRKLAALRSMFKDLTNTSQSLNYITHAGRMVLSGLVELNNQDVREFQQAYDRLVNFVTEPGNRQALLDEIGQSGITQVNFLDMFFELVLLGLLEGKTAHTASRPNGFLQLLFGLIMTIQPPGQSWTRRAELFLLRIKSQMQSWMDTMFDFEDIMYACPQRLSGEVSGNLEVKVEYLLTTLD